MDMFGKVKIGSYKFKINSIRFRSIQIGSNKVQISLEKFGEVLMNYDNFKKFQISSPKLG